jgi:HK97 family phage prohead protease
LDRLQSFGQVRAIDTEARRVTTVVSTGDIARDDAIIEQACWVFDNYDRNPVVLWAHDDRSLPIARTVGRSLSANELTQTHEFASHPMAEQVFDAIRGGFVNATSVRWYPISAEFRLVDGREVLVYTRQELLETSYVPIPADPGAIVVRTDGAALDREMWRPTPTEPEPALVAVEDSRAGRLAAFAAHLRETTAILKGAN